MSYKVLYRKYRPDDFENIVGQEYTVSMLKNAIANNKHAHAYIFTGPRGTGKTSSAKIFAKALNCENPVDGSPCNKCASCLSFKENPDVIEIDAASNNGVDEIRELINNVKLVPSNSKYKIYIIDEVHMLTTSAFNALLLTLEEPPAHVVFILATTDIQNVPITILSRCQRFDFKPVNKSAIIHRLKYVCEEESIKITDEALEEIAIISAGGLRDALGMLDQLSSSDEEITLESVSSYFGSVSPKKINELIECISQNKVEELLNIMKDVRESGTNYSVFIEKLISELRKNAISIKTGKANHDMLFEDVYSLIFDLNECLCNININIDPYILIEIVLMKYTKYFPGNNFVVDNYGLGNKNGVVLSNNVTSNSLNDNNYSNSTINKQENSLRNNNVSMGNSDNSNKNTVVDNATSKSKKNKVIHKPLININIRINNCFVDASKEVKASVTNSWIEFMNYLMNIDRNLISLLADINVLAASDKYVLIQSTNEATNALINESITSLEKNYSDFAGLNYRFAAVNDELWKKEVEKYRNNVKNKIKYNYMEEDIEETLDNDVVVEKSSDIENLAKDIFESYEVE